MPGSIRGPVARGVGGGWTVTNPTEAGRMHKQQEVHNYLEKATVRGRAWCKLLDAPVLTLDVTV